MARNAQEAIAKLDASERVQLAKLKITNVVNRISALLATAEHNALIVYSPLLASQIPPSSAGHAFNVFQKAMHNYEIVQLCALWDKPDETLAHNSTPTVHALIDDDAVVDQLVEEARGFWPVMGVSQVVTPRSAGDSDKDAALRDYNRLSSDRQATKAHAALSRLRTDIPRTLTSPMLASVRNIRDRYLAHALDQTRAERNGPIAPMKYGDERVLLDTTSQMIEDLYLWLTGAGFDLEQNRALQGKYAKALWGRCHFDIEARS